jgi:hypothetical protein
MSFFQFTAMGTPADFNVGSRVPRRRARGEEERQPGRPGSGHLDLDLNPDRGLAERPGRRAVPPADVARAERR